MPGIANTLTQSLQPRQWCSQDVWQPQLFRPARAADAQALQTLLEQQPGLQVVDTLPSQLQELMKLRHPTRRLNPKEMEAAIAQHLGPHSFETYGVWVYYPWRHQLVHVLDQPEFVAVRTNRNQLKITPEEQEQLHTKCIGVVGLSVGQTIAFTMAMERSFGEIRLADFDTIDLSNLNRLRTGLHYLGAPKVVVAAREIAEQDPFLKVVCYPQGLTGENLDDFFTKGGALDLLVEECDGIDMKVMTRVKAKALGIPVIMDTNDRGMLDVERFDLEPERPLLHGLIQGLDVNNLSNLSEAEKLPYLAAFVGAHSASGRLKASALEMDSTIISWPQLGSSVVLGGALVGDTARRILLGQFTASGRYYIDMEALINVPSPPTRPNPPEAQYPPAPALEGETVAGAAAKALESGILPSWPAGATLPEDQWQSLVHAAIQAPSGGNSQPWRWHVAQGWLFLCFDESRGKVLLDPNLQASYISLGAATENLVLEAHAQGLELAMHWFETPEHLPLVAAFRCYPAGSVPASVQPEPTVRQELHAFITARLTNREPTGREALPADALEDMVQAAASVPGAQLHLLQSPEVLAAIEPLLAAADKLRLTHPKGHEEFVREVRWTPQENQLKADGIDMATMGLNPLDRVGMMLLRDWRTVEAMKSMNTMGVFGRATRSVMEKTSAIGLLTMPQNSPREHFNGGRAMERMWLAASRHQLAFQPMTTLIFLFSRWLNASGQQLPTNAVEELQAMRTEFLQLFPQTHSNRGEIFLFRLAKAPKPAVQSLRRSVETVFTSV